MKAVLALLLVVVVVLGWEFNRQRTQIAELHTRLERGRLELQDRCAKQAREEFDHQEQETRALSGQKSALDDFSNHYNEGLNRCFLLVESTGPTMASATLWDAFDRQVMGSYVWVNPKGKPYWEVGPTQCRVVLPSGEEKTCKSEDEFNALIKSYMGDMGLGLR